MNIIPFRAERRRYIIECLKHFNWNRVHTAKGLGMSLRALRNNINVFRSQGFDIPLNESAKNPKGPGKQKFGGNGW